MLDYGCSPILHLKVVVHNMHRELVNSSVTSVVYSTVTGILYNILGRKKDGTLHNMK